jgi:hypothetical protein
VTTDEWIKELARRVAELFDQAVQVGFSVVMDDAGVWLGFHEVGAPPAQYGATVCLDIQDGEVKWTGG